MLLLLRHGRTAHNASRRALGRLDLPLDGEGRRQAAEIAASGVLRHVTRVISSPLQRAMATAEALGLPVEVDPRWVEMDYGVYDGLPLADIPPEVFTAWRTDPDWVPEGGESSATLGRRVREACEDLWEEAARSDVLVVSHVSPIKAAIGWALGLPLAGPARMFVEVASLHRVGPGEAGPVLRTFNEIHYRPLEPTGQK